MTVLFIERLWALRELLLYASDSLFFCCERLLGREVYGSGIFFSVGFFKLSTWHCGFFRLWWALGLQGLTGLILVAIWFLLVASLDFCVAILRCSVWLINYAFISRWSFSKFRLSVVNCVWETEVRCGRVVRATGIVSVARSTENTGTSLKLNRKTRRLFGRSWKTCLLSSIVRRWSWCHFSPLRAFSDSFRIFWIHISCRHFWCRWFPSWLVSLAIYLRNILLTMNKRLGEILKFWGTEWHFWAPFINFLVITVF